MIEDNHNFKGLKTYSDQLFDSFSTQNSLKDYRATSLLYFEFIPLAVPAFQSTMKNGVKIA